jgi:hypothetical protein
MIDAILSSLPILVGWVILMIISQIVLAYDIANNNPQIPSLMRVVWFFTVFYSGIVGLLVYWYTGRKQISSDSIWRRGFRSVSHCYSGCGSGEAVGVVIAVGILSLNNLWVAAVTFFFAYLFGYALTVGPLLQEGVSLKEAVSDAFYTETLSITVMEIVAISSDIILADGAGITEVRFWIALIISLTLGLLAAYPVNVALIRYGVKEGMMDPRKM